MIPRQRSSDDRLVSAAEAAAELGVPAGTVRGWKARELLFPVGQDTAGRPLYRLGQVRELAAKTRRRGAARGAGA